ncbi:MAG: YabN family protein [Lachnospirales bacterium]
MSEYKYNINDLKNVMKKLLGENGCPWDRAQTHSTLKKYLIEECYEAVEAINNEDMDNLCEELGDILFQVVFHSELAKNKGYFDLDKVINDVTDKMIYRHPHIFSNEGGNTKEEIIVNWDKLKEKEKGYSSKKEIILSVPKALPSLMRSQKVISKSEKYDIINLDFNEITNNISVLLERLKSSNLDHKEENMELIGNFLLELTKISQFLQINAEFSLTNALEKFINNTEDI